MNPPPPRPADAVPTVVVAVAAAVAGAAWVLLRPRRVVVEGSSMEPALSRGDRLLVLRRPAPAVGAVVAVDDPRGDGRILVKRLVAVDGDAVVVLGDNRASSTDSRVFGPVDRGRLLGQAVYRYHPPARAGRLGDRRRGVGPDSQRGTIGR